MTPERFKEIADKNKGNNMQLCYEVFCEEGRTKLSLQDFHNYFPVWITNQKVEELFLTGDINGITQRGLEEIEVYLKKKYEYEQ